MLQSLPSPSVFDAVSPSAAVAPEMLVSAVEPGDTFVLKQVVGKEYLYLKSGDSAKV
jgi:hypothetical protein